MLRADLSDDPTFWEPANREEMLVLGSCRYGGGLARVDLVTRMIFQAGIENVLDRGMVHQPPGKLRRRLPMPAVRP